MDEVRTAPSGLVDRVSKAIEEKLRSLDPKNLGAVSDADAGLYVDAVVDVPALARAAIEAMPGDSAAERAALTAFRGHMAHVASATDETAMAQAIKAYFQAALSSSERSERSS